MAYEYSLQRCVSRRQQELLGDAICKGPKLAQWSTLGLERTSGQLTPIGAESKELDRSAEYLSERVVRYALKSGQWLQHGVGLVIASAAATAAAARSRGQLKQQ